MDSTETAASKAPSPSLGQLRAFLETARLQSVSRASDELHRSQSAVTQSIKRLESHLSASLFERRVTGTYLTEVGRILERRVKAAFEAIEAAFAQILDGSADGARRAAVEARRVTRSQIASLTALRDFGSVAQAAQHIDISATTLHRSMREFERQIGAKLLKHDRDGATLNDAGKRFADRLRLAMREVNWAEEEIASQTGQLSGRLLIGARNVAGSDFATTSADAFLQQHPNVSINIIDGTYDSLLAKLRGGAIDLLFGILKDPPPAEDVREVGLAPDRFLIAARHGHPLAGGQMITRADLRAAEWIASQPGTGRRGVLERLLNEATPRLFRVETHSLPATFIMLANSDRLAIMTGSALAIDRQLGSQLVELDFPLGDPPAFAGVTIRRNWEPTTLQKRFLEFLAEHDWTAP